LSRIEVSGLKAHDLKYLRRRLVKANLDTPRVRRLSAHIALQGIASSGLDEKMPGKTESGRAEKAPIQFHSVDHPDFVIFFQHLRQLDHMLL
jgi:hypothetical protein